MHSAPGALLMPCCSCGAISAKMEALAGSKIVVKYAEGDFEGTVVRHVKGYQFDVVWDGNESEDSVKLDPNTMGKQYDAEQNGWQIMGECQLGVPD